MKYRLQLLLSFEAISVAYSGKHHHNHHNDGPSWSPGQVDWDESFDNFAPYPREALAGLPDELNNDLTSVQLDIVVSMNNNEDKPISSLLKGIVARNHRVDANHHFFIQDGWVYDSGSKTNCRKEAGNDLETKSMVWEPVNSKICQQSCTNQGRYCLSGNGKQPGKELVAESARRICLDDVFGTGNTVLWEYMDAFEKSQCDKAENMTICSHEAMHKVMKDKKQREVFGCVQSHGGLEVDGPNDKLEKAVEYRNKAGIGETENFPILKINGNRYGGDYHVYQLMGAVCDAFPANDTKPYACEYCGLCDDKRKCLWTLECNGETLNAVEVFGPLPWYDTANVREIFIGLAVLSVLVIVLLYAVRQVKIYFLIKELEAINRKVMDESLETRHAEGTRRASVEDHSDSHSSSRSLNCTPFFGEGGEPPLQALM